jgi:hypothetical protein
MTASEAAAVLGVDSIDHVYKLARAGAIAGRVVDGRWRLDRACVEARRKRIEGKRSSKSHRARDSAAAFEETRARFAAISARHRRRPA